MRFRIVALLFSLSCFGTALAEEPASLVPEYVRDCLAPCPRPAVIFVHGITGSQLTWGDPRTDTYWPKMLSKEQDLAGGIDIYRVDYNSRTFGGPAAVAVADSVGQRLDAVMEQKLYSKVIFIAHSLGGIIVRDYLLHVKSRYGHQALSRFRLLITLGTPNEGSSLASIAQWATDNEQIRVLRPIDVNDFQQLLNSMLTDVQAKHEPCLSLRTFAAYEEKPVEGLGIIVTKQSATRDAYESQGFDKNHIQLPKPVGQNDPVYRWATRAVDGCIKDEDAYCPKLTEAAVLSCPAGDFR